MHSSKCDYDPPGLIFQFVKFFKRVWPLSLLLCATACAGTKAVPASYDSKKVNQIRETLFPGPPEDSASDKANHDEI